MSRLVLFLLLVSVHLCNSQYPPSPFGKPKDICPTGNNQPYKVDNFVGTPFILTPFTNVFTNPTVLNASTKTCRPDGHCMFAYTIDIYDTTLRPFDQAVAECTKKAATKFLTYNGLIPGPTLRVAAGHESIVRFNNKINKYFPQSFSPCNGSRRGRPISVHHHGSASIPPYDGWAEDETCYLETKEYVYPNNRPATNWYHDHALHITADNAYLGLAGLHLVTSKLQYGGCGEPWNLEDIEEKHLILQDKVLDANCQLFIDPAKAHELSLYGDINLVSGIPFPRMPLEPKWYRFRILNAAVSRPWLLKILNSKYEDISKTYCKMIASDGGYRITPIPFPDTGLLVGVAERYEFVCDFTTFSNQILYLWNDKNNDWMQGVPYFCYTHLLSKLEIAPTTSDSPPQFNENMPMPIPERTITRVLNMSDYDTALQMANNGKFHRQMVFERSNNQWKINGQTWDSFKIAAADIGQNTWELWYFQTGGGWFHPVHVHLVDFYMIKREGSGGIRSFESMAAKDVLYLGASNKIYVLARFGPHKGDYMFHCHNLIHEDNDMMRAYRIIDSQNGINAGSAQPFILNGFAKIVYSNWLYADPMLNLTAAQPTVKMPPFDSTYKQKMLDMNIYRIFYPRNETDIPLNGFTNPWRSTWCSA
ncbi:unnamed protein product [Adineta steineri]|uniref:Plastocyanin-like domain-containing protein n=3 Tax=Adineta steineri TaxID=433720 RepID=A0A813MB32_9BILA|nr:unnamed protein product [Adineta steineri]